MMIRKKEHNQTILFMIKLFYLPNLNISLNKNNKKRGNRALVVKNKKAKRVRI